MARQVLLDTGPLVALLNARDRHHEWARRVASTLGPPFFTCEAVLAEACHLVRHLPGGIQSVLSFLQRDLIRLPLRLEEEATAIRKLILRYSNVPMSFADGCLVRLSETHPQSIVFTVDSDFSVYRRNGRQVIPTIVPRP